MYAGRDIKWSFGDHSVENTVWGFFFAKPVFVFILCLASVLSVGCYIVFYVFTSRCDFRSHLEAGEIKWEIRML